MNKVKLRSAVKRLLFGALFVILLIIGALFLFSLRSIDRSDQSRATSKLALIDKAAREVEQLQVEVLRHLLAADPEEIKRRDLRVRDIGKFNAGKLADYQQFVDTERERQLYERVMEALKANWEQTRAVLAFSGANRDAEATDVINSTQAAAYDEFLEAVNELHKHVEASAQDVATAMTRFISEIRLIGTALAGIAICLAIGTGFAVAGVARRLREDNWTLKVEVAERKRAEETLRDSEEKFRQLADNITDVFWMTSPDLKTIHYVSAGYELIWGRSAESLYSNPRQWVEAIVPEEREHVFAIFSGLTRDEQDVSAEFRIVRPDGTVRWVHDRGFQVRDAAGNLVRLTGIVTDTTERKQIEDALQRQQTELRVLFDLLPAMIWFKDTENGILRVNKRVAESAGRPVEEIEGKSTLEIYPQQAARFYADDLDVIRSGRPKLGIVETIRGSDGNEIWVQTDKVPYSDKGGNVLGILVVAQDITGKKRAEEALRESEERFAGAFEHASIGMALVAPDGRWTKVNRALCDLIGYSEADLLTRTFQDITHPEDLESDLEYVRRILAGEIRSYQVEKRYLHARGNLVTVMLNVSLVRGGQGQPLYFIAQIQDITEHKRSQAELESVHKQLLEASRQGGMAEIATNVLHNVGNVLNSVNVSASLAVESMKKSEASGLARAVKLIREHESELGTFLTSDPRGKLLPAYLAQLSENLLVNQEATLKELDSLHGNIEHIKEIVSVQQSYASVSGLKEIVNVSSLVEDSLRMNANALNRHGIVLKREFQEVPAITIDKHKVLQVLVNLVRNAKYACEESGRADKQLTVRVANGGEWLDISVIDNGVGVPRENLTRIFNHGFTTRKDGHGFGLHGGALAAKEMGGSLTVQSEGPGRGASFTLKLPSQPDTRSQE